MVAKLITAIRVQKLFGLYTYNLPDTGEFSNAAILYGDNGVGKSTLLRLAFHLLSTANDKGHRGALYKSDFKTLEVDLASGVTISAKIDDKTSGRLLTMEISRKNDKLAIWEYQPKAERSSLFEEEVVFVELTQNGERVLRRGHQKNRKHSIDSIPRGNDAFLSVLSKFSPAIFILNAERRLDSDTVSDPSDEIELRRVMRYEEPKRINELLVRSREIALSQALATASKWISQKAVIGANQGSMNVHSVYIDVLSRLRETTGINQVAVSERSHSSLIEQLAAIENKTNELSKYELATTLSTSEFQEALRHKVTNNRDLAADLLQPYIKSLEGRLNAVDPIYQIINRFVSLINGFLNDKQISFKLSQGFHITNKLGSPLSPAQLSSGEQQLLLLFCYVLTARDKPSVFMIDEPEISLNIKWQRQLIQSLLDITINSDIQFIFASHSMELLSQHRNRVIRLVSE